MPQKELLVVGGPNGAGKSTLIAEYLKQHPRPYLSADLIATEFPNLDEFALQIEAGREFVRRGELSLLAEKDFVIETTMSGRTLRNFLARARSIGFDVTIVFIFLDSPENCIARVKDRVRRGGHHVPEEDIRRRFGRRCANFWRIYRQIADYWYVVYNSSGEFQRIASGEADSIRVHEESAFRRFLRLAGVSDAEIDN